MTIRAIEYFSKSGLVCQGVFGVNAFPYNHRDVQHDGGPIGVRWCHNDQKFLWRTGDKVSIYPSPDMQFLIVVFLRNPPAVFDFPHNVLVLNADGTVRHAVRQPERYAGQKTEFIDAWWYAPPPSNQPPWWAFWRNPDSPMKTIRMKLLVGWLGDPNCAFEALDFDPETGLIGDLVDSGRL